jgi:hypothetical protein
MAEPKYETPFQIACPPASPNPGLHNSVLCWPRKRRAIRRRSGPRARSFILPYLFILVEAGVRSFSTIRSIVPPSAAQFPVLPTLHAD